MRFQRPQRPRCGKGCPCMPCQQAARIKIGLYQHEPMRAGMDMVCWLQDNGWLELPRLSGSPRHLPELAQDLPRFCRCGGPTKVWSAYSEEAFCSDECADKARRGEMPRMREQAINLAASKGQDVVGNGLMRTVSEF